MNMKKFSEKLKSLSRSPGVYLFKDETGEVIYVGKAKNLRNRVRSYFNSHHELDPKTVALVSKIADLEYILCDTETESLMLENNLIKKYQPRYNILLRDDKNYQFIKIDYSTQIPQIYTARKIDSKKAKFFGPYTSGLAVRETLRLLRYIFPYCSNKKIGLRPCFYYHLGRCPGVCAGKIALAEYQVHMKKIEKFLGGEMQRTVTELKRDMKTAAAKKLFERAARLRDQTVALSRMLEKQKIISPTRENHDTVSLYQAGSLAAITLFQIRGGKLVGRENFLLDNTKDQPESDILRAFLERYYLETSDVPPEIDTQVDLDGTSALANALNKKINRRVTIVSPSRGRKRKLLKLGVTNARDHLDKSTQNMARELAVATRALFELKEKLDLPDIPLRIECFDISNIQGTNPTGSMVVFENGKPKKSDYKRFAVRGLDTPNDVEMMREVLTRRLARSDLPQRGEKKNLSWRPPDLLVVDGGRSQLNVAESVLKEKKLKLPIIGLAKRLEEVYRVGFKTPLLLPKTSPGLQLLQRIRDEAHRFAVSYHRKKRSKSMLEREPD